MFFERVTELCQRKGISLSTAAKEIGLSNSAITYWKRGAVPKASTVQKLADYFGVSTDHLLGKEKTPTVSGEHDILSEIDIAFYNGFKELTEEQQETIRDMVRLMRERRKDKK